MIQYKNEQIYTSTPLDCSNMNNDESGCKNLQVIQKAILDKEKDVNICVPMDGRKEFPICIAQFTGTDVWKN